MLEFHKITMHMRMKTTHAVYPKLPLQHHMQEYQKKKEAKYPSCTWDDAGQDHVSCFYSQPWREIQVSEEDRPNGVASSIMPIRIYSICCKGNKYIPMPCPKAWVLLDYALPCLGI